MPSPSRDNAEPSNTPRPAQRTHFILGTAGHIDHGKTSLVKALTGTDTDRLPEEKRRGMTIELGFAEMTIGHAHFGVVDVPGHEKFVRTMVAGATGIDVALLIVAADDSVMPQTIEHVSILRLLGVPRMVVAITKIDVVEPDMADLVAAEVDGLLADTPFAEAAIYRVSSVTGAGLDDLRAAILDASRRVATAPADRPFRMCVDRVFTLPGRGTIVTGSVLRGRADVGETLEVFPAAQTCRVRDLQSHGIGREHVGGGQRAAINVGGIDRERIERGSELATPGYLEPSRIMDVSLTSLPSNERALKSASVVRIGMGTTEAPVRVVLFDREQLDAGDTAYAQLRCGRALTAAHGQRFILRDASATHTIGGGMILRPVARRRRWTADRECAALRQLEHGDEADRLEDVLTLSGFERPPDLRLCARAGIEPGRIAAAFERLHVTGRLVAIRGTDLRVVPAVIDELTARATAWLQRFHEKNADQPGRPADALLGHIERAAGRAAARAVFDGMIASKAIRQLGRFVCLPAFAPALSAADERNLEALVRQIRDGGLRPPALSEVVIAPKPDAKRLEKLATLAVALGELVKIDATIYLHAESERKLRETVAALIAKKGPVAVSEVREALDSSRKFVVPFMEYLDRAGFTKRVDDRRILA